ncbi:MAG: hypothetical protein E6772_05760 [Dysgonomonas sp.]|nr:hypothetical protein [Dysgonomonas sp.]
MSYTEEKDLNSGQEEKYDFKWHEIGEGNPFNKKILDVRPLTWNVLAFTKDKEVAETYNRLRNSTGREYIGSNIPENIISEINIEYPHNGTSLEGIVFKADSMDCKWDIYIYDNIFYFTRSWTGDLVYKAYVTISEDKLMIYKIEFSPDTWNENIAKNDIHFLLKTHAMGQVLPHKVPDYLQTDMDIALYSFKQFGNKGCYACFDDITDTIITVQK